MERSPSFGDLLDFTKKMMKIGETFVNEMSRGDNSIQFMNTLIVQNSMNGECEGV